MTATIAAGTNQTKDSSQVRMGGAIIRRPPNSM
jgi:hypothetical protein